MKKSISDKVINILKYWPFSKLTVAKNIKMEKKMRIPSITKIPQNDKLELLTCSFPLLIPIEEKDNVLKVIENIIEEYGHLNTSPRSEVKLKLEEFKPDRNLWYTIGRTKFNPSFSLNFNRMEINLMYLSESFICVCFTLIPSDKLKYDLYKLNNFNYEKKIILKTPKLKNIFKSWGHIGYPPSWSFKKNFYSFFNEIREDFACFLRKNNFNFYLGNKEKIPSIYTLNFNKEPVLNKLLKKDMNNQRKNDFWHSLNIRKDDPTIFSDEKDHFIIVEKDTRKKIFPKGMQIMYISGDNIDLPYEYWTLETYMQKSMKDWGLIYPSVFSVNSFINHLYYKIRKIGKQYYITQENSKEKIDDLINLSQKVQGQKYWFDLLSNEFTMPEKNTLEYYNFPNFHLGNEADNDEYNWYSLKKSEIENKIEKLKDLFEVFSKNIEGYKNIILAKTNQKIQRWLIILTFITVLIGVAQLLNIKIPETIFKLINLFL